MAKATGGVKATETATVTETETETGRWAARREKAFLAALAETSNVSAAARAAGLASGTVYRRRMTDDGFRARWSAALREGYAKLEGAMLERALSGVEKRVERGGETVVTREYNDQVALRLLAMHRGSASGAAPVAAGDDRAAERTALKTRLGEINRRMGGAG